MNIKRGKILIFNNRKGISHDLFFNVFELILAFIIILALFNFINDVAGLTLFKRNYLARDISLLVNALYTAPTSDAVLTTVDYRYDEDMRELILEFSRSRIDVNSKNDKDDIKAFYFFGENTKASLFPYGIVTYYGGATSLNFIKSTGALEVEEVS